MSESGAILAFVAFGIECYKKRHQVDGATVAALFARLGVDRYLYDEYDVLHTMGERELIDDLDRYVAVRGGK